MIGASFDTVEDQATFASEQSFPFTLISDATKEIGESYRATRTKGMKYFEAGIPRRISYLINPDGVIARTYNLDGEGVDLDAHSAQLLADIATFKAEALAAAAAEEGTE